MTDQDFLGLRRGDALYALGYAGESPEIVAYVFESRATGGRIIARKPSILRPGEDEIVRLHVSTTYLTPQAAARAHVAEAERAIPYFERRLAEAKAALGAARSWAERHGAGRDEPTRS